MTNSDTSATTLLHSKGGLLGGRWWMGGWLPPCMAGTGIFRQTMIWVQQLGWFGEMGDGGVIPPLCTHMRVTLGEMGMAILWPSYALSYALSLFPFLPLHSSIYPYLCFHKLSFIPQYSIIYAVSYAPFYVPWPYYMSPHIPPYPLHRLPPYAPSFAPMLLLCLPMLLPLPKPKPLCPYTPSNVPHSPTMPPMHPPMLLTMLLTMLLSMPPPFPPPMSFPQLTPYATHMSPPMHPPYALSMPPSHAVCAPLYSPPIPLCPHMSKFWLAKALTNQPIATVVQPNFICICLCSLPQPNILQFVEGICIKSCFFLTTFLSFAMPQKIDEMTDS